MRTKSIAIGLLSVVGLGWTCFVLGQAASGPQPTPIAIPSPEPVAAYQQAEDWFVQNSKEHRLTVFGKTQISISGKGTVAVDGDQPQNLNGHVSVSPTKYCEIKVVGSIDIWVWQDKAKVIFTEDAYLESDGKAFISLSESKPAIYLGGSAHYKAVKLEELVVGDSPVKLYASHCGQLSVKGDAVQIFADHCKEVSAKWNARVQAHYCQNVKAVDNVSLTCSHCQNLEADKTCTVIQK